MEKHKDNKLFRIFALACLSLFIQGCTDNGFLIRSGGRQSTSINGSSGAYKIGNPYQVDGIWYYPKEDYSYSEVGTASWYGPQFHSKVTANGEIFDMNSFTAAHKTLPLPSIVRVTNLENGRSLVLRVNDRGPFVNNRVMDVSRRAAQMLGFKEKGTAKVRVDVLPEESKNLKRKLVDEGDEVSTPQAAYPASTVTSETIAPPKKTPDMFMPKLANSPQQAQKSDDDGWIDEIDVPAAKPTNAVPQSINAPSITKEVVVNKTVTQSVKTPVAFAKDVYSVQVGAYSNQDSANKLASSLSAVAKSSVSSININGKTLYRVRVGEAANSSDIDAVLGKLKEIGYGEARVVKDVASSQANDSSLLGE